MKVAICSSEVVPFAKTGGLADVAGALPIALEDNGLEVIVIMPAYKCVRNKPAGIHKSNEQTIYGSEANVNRSEASANLTLRAPKTIQGEPKGQIGRIKEDISFAVIGKNIKVYFVENDAYFNRDGLYGDKKGDYPDNLERFSYYCLKSLELLKEINFPADIIHCNDWQTALIPVYLKAVYQKDKFYKNIRTVLTIHNIGYQGLFPKEKFGMLDLPKSLFSMEKLEYYGNINILKGGIVFSDVINTVSPTYSKEIQTKEFGFGLKGVLAGRKNSLFGILNGIDYSIWDPQTDKIIAKNYSAEDLKGKEVNKETLQEICGFDLNRETPLFGMVARLVEHKGLDLLAPELETFCHMNAQLIILGMGDDKFHNILEKTAKKHPKNLSLHLKFDEVLAHNIYAGSDIFLMPSKYEPCGLGQLISLRYGSVPLVFKTGGLADTVTKDRGFVFDRYRKDDLIKTIKEAAKAYADKPLWNNLVVNAMKSDFSWNNSAKEYINLYERAGSSK